MTGNLVRFSGQSLEHLHSVLKRIERTASTPRNVVSSLFKMNLGRELLRIERLGECVALGAVEASDAAAAHAAAAE